MQTEEIIRQESNPEAPIPPTSAQPVGQGFASVALSWQDNAVNEAEYYIYRSTDNQNWQRVASLGPDQSGYIDQWLARYTQYWYRVSSWNSLGESQPVTTTAQTGFEQAEPVGTITPNVGISTTTTISYTYDSLSRLAGADYSSGIFYHYTYDSVGNRLSEEKLTVTTNYTYDIANRMNNAGGITCTWDANGNLLHDETNTYTYDHANQLKTVSGQGVNASYAYNGLGDRLQGTVNGQTSRFTMDLNAGLSQALSDETNIYWYGVGRIAQQHGSQKEYFLADPERTVHASGSVGQLADDTSITLNESINLMGSCYSARAAVIPAAGLPT